MSSENVEKRQVCPSCGARNEGKTAYCAYCGTMLPKVQSVEGATEGVIAIKLPGERIAFKRISVGLVLFLSIITLGVYPAFWVFLRRNSFNQLKVSEKIQDWLALLPLILWGVSFVLGANEGEGEQILALLSFVTWVFLSFKMRKMLREYVAGFADEEALKSVARSGIMTFFFLIFYIQYHINRLIDIGVFKRAN
ncbi:MULTISPECIES: DUF4234 domain-containing protein [Aminobacterium]|jgi:hypothetical protein|uniref:DUF4234 domain-containing protein n=1 Tax=Aminobacterium TaxID=81466 RepID=UPI00257C4289|nr:MULTISPECIES: DUF4234 domain-containing protein [unclassified Aminobacterium]